jgi:hypothetical protein
MRVSTRSTTQQREAIANQSTATNPADVTRAITTVTKCPIPRGPALWISVGSGPLGAEASVDGLSAVKGLLALGLGAPPGFFVVPLDGGVEECPAVPACVALGDGVGK